MSHRLLRSSDFKGKTISRIDAHAVNVTRFYFTDGTSATIEVDALGHGVYGMVLCDECSTTDKKTTAGKGWAVQLDKAYVRKRDKMVVTINKLTPSKVEYVTHPMLEVWPIKRASFMKNFRPATAEEAKEAK